MRYVALQHDMFHFVQHDIYSLCSYSIWYKFHNVPKGTYRATGISYPQGYIANSVRNLYRFGKNYLKTPSPQSFLISFSFDLSQHKVFGLRFLETLFVFSKTQKRFVEYIIKYTSAFSLSFVLPLSRRFYWLSILKPVKNPIDFWRKQRSRAKIVGCSIRANK